MRIDMHPDNTRGRTYEHEYNGWLELFRRVAESKNVVEASNVPLVWEALVHYLGARIKSTLCWTHEGTWLDGKDVTRAEEAGLLRRYVEMTCTLRPELVDALYKSDMEWKTVSRRDCGPSANKGSLLVTNNGSFFAPHILKFIDVLHAFRSRKRNCVIVPCAADKPYPAPLHKAVKELLPDDGWHIIIATGVLGLVPEELWDQMPLYDSGMPNQWRVMQETERYFSLNEYDRAVVYSDFYAEAVIRGLPEGVKTEAVCGAWRAQYEDLLSSHWLGRLEQAL